MKPASEMTMREHIATEIFCAIVGCDQTYKAPKSQLDPDYISRGAILMADKLIEKLGEEQE